MAYRDDLPAAQQRVAQLEAELDEAREEIARLKDASMTRRASPLPALALPPPSARRFGRLRYHPPRTYWPMLPLYVGFLREMVRGSPSLDRPDSDKLLAWIGHGLMIPLVYALWFPAYWLLTVCVVIPWVTMMSLALTPLLPIYVALTRLTFSDVPPSSEGWLGGQPTRGEATRLFLAVLVFIPFMVFLPVFATVLDRLADD